LFNIQPKGIGEEMIPRNQVRAVINNIKYRAGRVNVLLNGGSVEDLNQATEKLNEAMMEYAEVYNQHFPAKCD